MEKILISACLLGENVRYNAEVADILPQVSSLYDRYEIIPVCPEVDGGLAVPREACEIQGTGEGGGVLDGTAQVIGRNGTNCTAAFVKGANSVLKKALDNGVKLAVLKQRSPSCGSAYIYTGNFDGTKIKGAGVCTALLVRNSIEVISEEDI
jgi:uncharacterized protein YbbK (DUF523 family)